MISIVRTTRRLCIVAAAIAAFLPATHAYADQAAYVSATGPNTFGSGTQCTAAQPCPSITNAASPGGLVVCLNAVVDISVLTMNQAPFNLQIDCPHGMYGGLFLTAGLQTVVIRNLTFRDFGFAPVGINFTVAGGGLLILENCVFDGYDNAAVSITSSNAVNLVIRNSRISNSGAGILLKPQAGGSINATLDHVAITGNVGGGIKIDTTNGPVTVDVADSVVSYNGGNGINALGNGGGQAIVSIKNSVIARNGAAGVQANGASAGVLLSATLLDQNAFGATSVVNSGNMFSYGNNQIIGPVGSGFNQTTTLQ